MKGTIPTLHCDDDGGCTEWTPDWYEMGASNWRSLIGEWQYDPYRFPGVAYCAEHATKGDA